MTYSIWTEKYRPQDFDEMVGQGYIRERIKAFVESKQIPHLLFAGPAGVGKSTVALIIAKKLFGRSWKSNFLETNASDERGIQMVRSKIKDFARTKTLGKVPFKIIFLDEADALTSDAQNALRRTMENYSEVCRFFLSCNYSSKIIEPIQSRCAVFRFRSIKDDDIKNRLEFISKEEKINVDSKALKAICNLADGDIRKAINILQMSATNTEKIDEKTIYEIVSTATPAEIKKMVEKALKGKFIDARKLLTEMILTRGISGEDIIKLISTQIFDMDITEKAKVHLAEKVGEFEFRLNVGANEQIQLEALLAQFALFK